MCGMKFIGGNICRAYCKMCCYASEVGKLLSKTTRAQKRHLQMSQTRKNRPRNLCRIGHTRACSSQCQISKKNHACTNWQVQTRQRRKNSFTEHVPFKYMRPTVTCVKVIGHFLNVCMLYESYSYQRVMRKYSKTKWNTGQSIWIRHVVL